MFDDNTQSNFGKSYADYKPYFEIFVGRQSKASPSSTETQTSTRPAPVNGPAAQNPQPQAETASEPKLEKPLDVSDILAYSLESMKVTMLRNKPSELEFTFVYSSDDYASPEGAANVAALWSVISPRTRQDMRIVVVAGLRLDPGSQGSENYSMKFYDLEEIEVRKNSTLSSQNVGNSFAVGAGETAEQSVQRIRKAYLNVGPDKKYAREATAVSVEMNSSSIIFSGQLDPPNVMGSEDGVIRISVRGKSTFVVATNANPMLSTMLYSDGKVGGSNYPTTLAPVPTSEFSSFATIDQSTKVRSFIDIILKPPETAASSPPAQSRSTRSGVTRSDILRRYARNATKQNQLKVFWNKVDESGVIFNTSALGNMTFGDLVGEVTQAPANGRIVAPSASDRVTKVLDALRKPKSNLIVLLDHLTAAFDIAYTIVPYGDTTDYSQAKARFSVTSSRFRGDGQPPIDGKNTVLLHPKNISIVSGIREILSPEVSLKRPVLSLRYGDEVVNFTQSASGANIPNVSTRDSGSGRNATKTLVIGAIVDGLWKVDFEIDQDKIKEAATKRFGIATENREGMDEAFKYFTDLAKEDPEYFLSMFTALPVNNSQGIRRELSSAGGTVQLDLKLRHPIPGVSTGLHIFFESNRDDRPLIPTYLETVYRTEKITHEFKAQDEIYTMTLGVSK